MSDREPVLLVVLIEARSMSWYVGAITPEHQTVLLLRSEPGDLEGDTDRSQDEQVSFLRHRLAGVMQRGGDRLYTRQMKAAHFLLIADGLIDHSTSDSHAASGVTEQLADHFVQWMISPPATYVLVPTDFDARRASDFSVVAGELPDEVLQALQTQLPALAAARKSPERWETVVRPASSDFG